MVMDALTERSFAVLPADPRTAKWAEAAREAARKVTADPEMQAKWLRHDRTWFVGVDALPTGPDGEIGKVPLHGSWEGIVPTIHPLHPAQLSVVYRGYPGRDAGESDAAHRFRARRDAAHLDGLLAEGPDKRRHLREPHAYILGIALTQARACPLVVWEGSHEIIRDAFMTAFAGLPPAMWADIDVTEVYKDARAEVFEMCHRTEVPLEPGQAVLVHRLAIHGVAPWQAGQTIPDEGRMMAYFRPCFPDPRDWLRAS